MKPWFRIYHQCGDFRLRHYVKAVELRFGWLGYQGGLIVSAGRGVGFALWENSTYECKATANWWPAV
jgi:hypothetical protein